MSFGAITSGSFNPARTLVPALATGEYAQVGLYVVAQLGGIIVAGLLYRFVWKDTKIDTNTSALPGLPARS